MDVVKIVEKIATLEAQGKYHTEQIHEVKDLVKGQGGDIKLLLAMRWQAIGAGAVLGLISGLVVEILRK